MIFVVLIAATVVAVGLGSIIYAITHARADATQFTHSGRGLAVVCKGRTRRHHFGTSFNSIVLELNPDRLDVFYYNPRRHLSHQAEKQAARLSCSQTSSALTDDTTGMRVYLSQPAWEAATGFLRTHDWHLKALGDN